MTARERKVLAGGGVIAAALLALLLKPAAAPPPAAAPIALLVPTPVAPPASAPVAELPEAPPEPEATLQPDLSGLVLHGVNHGAAVIAVNGRQRLIREGRPVAPGISLAQIGAAHVMLETAAGPVRLGFSDTAGAIGPPAPTPAPSAARPASASAAGAQAVVAHRLALAPVRRDGRIAGFAVRSTERMPILAAAGLRPGDVLLSVNGQDFTSEERVMELGTDLANAVTADFEFLRDGQRMRRSLAVNPRR